MSPGTAASRDRASRSWPRPPPASPRPPVSWPPTGRSRRTRTGRRLATRRSQAMESGTQTAGSWSGSGLGSGAAAMSMPSPASTVSRLATVADGHGVDGELRCTRRRSAVAAPSRRRRSPAAPARSRASRPASAGPRPRSESVPITTKPERPTAASTATSDHDDAERHRPPAPTCSHPVLPSALISPSAADQASSVLRSAPGSGRSQVVQGFPAPAAGRGRSAVPPLRG